MLSYGHRYDGYGKEIPDAVYTQIFVLSVMNITDIASC